LGITERLLWNEQIDKLVDCHQHLSEFGSAAEADFPGPRKNGGFRDKAILAIVAGSPEAAKFKYHPNGGTQY
jgi:hypothetical protein